MIGDQTDVFSRLQTYLAPWFGAGGQPAINALLNGAASILSGVYGLYAYAKLQTRIRTATGPFLDLIAEDFFGDQIRRKPGQSDDSFRAWILINLFRPRATRPSMQSLLTDITGQAPIIFEPWRPLDTGACSTPASPGYCGVARAGSLSVPFTCLITAFRPQSQIGLVGAAFCNAPARSATSSLKSVPSLAYCDSLALTSKSADDADIYAAIDANKVAGTVCWVALKDGLNTPPNPYLGT